MYIEAEDIDMLMDALDALERDGAMGETMGSMLAMMLSANREEYEKMKREHTRDEVKRKQDERILKERIILLKAKLIRFKDSIVSRI